MLIKNKRGLTMTHKQYATNLFNLIKQKGYTTLCFSECGDKVSENDIIKMGVEYADINIMNSDNKSIGFITWISDYYADDSINDYSCNLDDILGLDAFIKYQTINA